MCKIKIGMKKGLTVVEVAISFTVALTLLLSLYAIVYWGTRVSNINKYYIDANNILIFLVNEIQNRPYLYIVFDPSTNSFKYKQDAKDILLGKLKLYNYKINGKEDFDIELHKIRKNPTINTLVIIEISLLWKYQNKNQNTNITFITSTFEIRDLINSRDPIIPLPPNSDIN